MRAFLHGENDTVPFLSLNCVSPGSMQPLKLWLVDNIQSTITIMFMVIENIQGLGDGLVGKILAGQV